MCVGECVSLCTTVLNKTPCIFIITVVTERVLCVDSLSCRPTCISVLRERRTRVHWRGRQRRWGSLASDSEPRASIKNFSRGMWNKVQIRLTISAAAATATAASTAAS